MKYYTSTETFILENGKRIPGITIAYNSYGYLNNEGNNVIWICHALTANSAVHEWWKNLVGDGLLFDTSKFYIVCANILGSCYGTTGPSSINSKTKKPFYDKFPAITIRDMVKAHELLRQSLGIHKIHLLVGGSMGGYQALEWSVMRSELIDNLFLLATSAKETAWGISIHTAQRMAIETDSTWGLAMETAGKNGLKTARAIGMLTYRSYEAFMKTQSDEDSVKLDNYKASSYMLYQGNKLANRFTAYSYWYLTKAMDTHNLARHRGELIEVLKEIKAKTLVLGITSDLLCPLSEQKFLSQYIPKATFVAIDSLYGHDGFLVETKAITYQLSNWLNTK